MKRLVYALAFAASTVVAFPAMAQGGGETVFGCRLGNGKFVRVMQDRGTFTYRYGTARTAEMTLTGNARSGNLHHWQQRYAGMLRQLRFSNGNTHYIVYTMDGNGQTGARAVSGLVVMRGTRRIGDYQCRPQADFQSSFDQMGALPEDSERFSAM